MFIFTDFEDSELESMALHETQDSKVFQRFKERIANEPEQVSCSDVWTCDTIRYGRTNAFRVVKGFCAVHLKLCFSKVLRYCKGGSTLYVSAEHVLNEEDIPKCPCGAKRIFEFQVM